jgi:DNA-binding MarR family transcriptional regulator
MTRGALAGGRNQVSGGTRTSSALRLDDYLPYRLSVATNAVSRLIARTYESRFALTIPQWRLVAVLAESGALTPQAIGARTVMDKVTVVRAAQALLKRRLIKRVPHATDRRSHHLMLSDSGLLLYQEVAPLALAYEAELLNQFDPVQIERLKSCLRDLEAAANRLASITPLSLSVPRTVRIPRRSS